MEKNEVQIEKEPVQATKSNYLKERLSVPVTVKNAFAHIRYATIGNVEYKNCHPYTMRDEGGRKWTLVHNGTIFEYQKLNRYVGLQAGDIVRVDECPFAYNRIVDEKYFNRETEELYALGPVDDREAVIIFNEKTRKTAEATIEYFI